MLNTTNTVEETIDYLIKHYGIVDVIATNMIERDAQHIKETAAERIDQGRWSYFSFYEWVGDQALYYAETMLQLKNYNESEVIQYFEACDGTNETLVRLSDGSQTTTVSTTLEVTTTAMSSTVTSASANSTAHIDVITPDQKAYCNQSFVNNHTETVWQEFKTIINNNTSLNSDAAKVLWEQFPDFLKIFLETNSYKTLIEDQTSNVTNLFQNVNSSDIFELLCGTAEEEVTTTAAPVQVTDSIPTLPAVEGQLPEDVINCSSVFHDAERYLTVSLYNLDRYMPSILELEKTYLSKVNPIYVNMSEILAVLPQHKKCMDMIHHIGNLSLELDSFYHTMKNISVSKSVSEAIPLLKRLYDQYFLWKVLNVNFTRYGRIVDSYDNCEWHREASYDEAPKVEEVIEKVEDSRDDRVSANQYVHDAFTQYNGLESMYNAKIFPTLMLLPKYLTKNMSKVELATEFQKIVFTKALNDLADLAAEMVSYAKDFKNAVTTLSIDVTEGFKKLSRFTMPVLNYINVKELSFYKAAKALNKKTYNDIIDTFETDFQSGISRLLQLNYDDFVAHALEMTNLISDVIDELTDSTVSLQSDLATYRDQVKMDTNFYM